MGRAVNYSIIFSASIETFGHAVHQESFSMLLVSYGVGCLLAAVIPGEYNTKHPCPKRISYLAV